MTTDSHSVSTDPRNTPKTYGIKCARTQPFINQAIYFAIITFEKMKKKKKEMEKEMISTTFWCGQEIDRATETFTFDFITIVFWGEQPLGMSSTQLGARSPE